MAESRHAIGKRTRTNPGEIGRRTGSWPLALLLAGGLIVCGSGCVQRRLLVNSSPAGALVLLDDKEVGYTPVAVDFTHYGTRKLTLIKGGYETLNVLQKIPAPWYQWPGVDFFSDNLLPVQVTDRQRLTYHLQPKMIVPTNDLEQRGEQLRSEAQFDR